MGLASKTNFLYKRVGENGGGGGQAGRRAGGARGARAGGVCVRGAGRGVGSRAVVNGACGAPAEGGEIDRSLRGSSNGVSLSPASFLSLSLSR